MSKTIHFPEYLTATIVNWQYLLKPNEYKMKIIDQLKLMVEFDKIVIYAFCIMDNHLHLIWQVLGENKSAEMQKQLFERTAKAFKADLLENRPQDLENYISKQSDRPISFGKGGR